MTEKLIGPCKVPVHEALGNQFAEYGGVIALALFRVDENGAQKGILLVKDEAGKWTVPKYQMCSRTAFADLPDLIARTTFQIHPRDLLAEGQKLPKVIGGHAEERYWPMLSIAARNVVSSGRALLVGTYDELVAAVGDCLERKLVAEALGWKQAVSA